MMCRKNIVNGNIDGFLLVSCFHVKRINPFNNGCVIIKGIFGVFLDGNVYIYIYISIYIYIVFNTDVPYDVRDIGIFCGSLCGSFDVSSFSRLKLRSSDDQWNMICFHSRVNIFHWCSFIYIYIYIGILLGYTLHLDDTNTMHKTLMVHVEGAVKLKNDILT